MTYEIRKGAYTLKGNPRDVRGAELKVGDDAPDFELMANDFSTKTLADYAGKIKLINVVPSLETGICDAQTRRFNEDATSLSDDVVVITVSADLPFTQRRWCGASGIDNIITLSSHMDMKFSDDYGVHDLVARLNQRSVFIVDKDNKVVYARYNPEFAADVDFESALNALKELVG